LSCDAPLVTASDERQIRVKPLTDYQLSSATTCGMSDEHTPTLQQIAADRDWWSERAGAHYRELAHWLRGVAAKCRLPATQKEILNLARRYESRANHLGRRGAAR
jgi:hypothetical protein